jgi:hypothetical protein
MKNENVILNRTTYCQNIFISLVTGKSILGDSGLYTTTKYKIVNSRTGYQIQQNIFYAYKLICNPNNPVFRIWKTRCTSEI